MGLDQLKGQGESMQELLGKQIPVVMEAITCREAMVIIRLL
jgi:hypothetical protein